MQTLLIYLSENDTSRSDRLYFYFVTLILRFETLIWDGMGVEVVLPAHTVPYTVRLTPERALPSGYRYTKGLEFYEFKSGKG